MNFKFSLLSALVLLTMMITLVSAQPPFPDHATFTEGWEIKFPPQQIITQSQDYTFHFHVYNISNGVPINISNSSVTCHFHMYNSSGNHIITMEQKIVDNMFDYEFPVNGSTFTQTGIYTYVIQCDNLQQGVATLGGFDSVAIEIVGARGGMDNKTFLYLILISAAGLLVFAASTRNEYAGFMSGGLFMIAGVYLMAFGFGIMSDIYTRAIAFTALGIGALICMAAGYKVVEELRSGQAW